MDGDTHVWSIPLYTIFRLKEYVAYEMGWEQVTWGCKKTPFANRRWLKKTSGNFKKTAGRIRAEAVRVIDFQTWYIFESLWGMPVKCLLIVLSSNLSVAVVEDVIKATLQAATLFKQSLRTITCIAGHSSTNSGKKVSNYLKIGQSNRRSTDSTDSFLKFFSKVFLSHRRVTNGFFSAPFWLLAGCA